MMLTLYADASGDVDQDRIIVAGYVATIEKWTQFDYDWKLLLAKYGLPYFHMSDFAHSRPPFEHLKGQAGTRRNILSGLAEIIRATVLLSIASSIRYQDFATVNKDYALAEAFGCEYAMCGRDCVVRGQNVLVKMGYQGDRFRAIFEQGDVGHGHLSRILVRDKKVSPIFEPSRPGIVDGHPGLTPLQAADFVAYELFKGRQFKDEGKEFRKSLHALSGVPWYWGQWTLEDLLEGAKKANLERDTMTQERLNQADLGLARETKD